ncbi:hypothetical protein LNQ52_19690 [Klebsiella pneumoniae subsp. pneumoniae]|nr:hypothetical protein [Klebsiella pneumoniae subsp. pneumoniae]
MIVQPDKNPIANANAENLTSFFLHNVTSSVNQNLPIPEQSLLAITSLQAYGEKKLTASCSATTLSPYFQHSAL